MDSRHIQCAFSVAALVFGVGGISTLAAQASLPISGVEAAHSDGFGRLTDVVPLADGRVVVLDELEGRVVLLDRSLSRGIELIRSGSGPGEARVPIRLLRAKGALLVVDRAASKFVRLDESSLAPADWFVPARDQCPAKASGIVNSAKAVDASGRVISAASGARASLTGRLDIVRWLDACRADTIASVRVPIEAGAGQASGLAFSTTPRAPFPGSVQWAWTSDDRVVVAESDGFRLRTFDGGGASLERTIPYTAIPVSAAHREDWKRQMTAPSLSLIRDRRANTMTKAVERPEWTEPRSWPRVLPPFLDNALIAADDGTVWLTASTPAEEPPTIMVIDAQLRVIGRVMLPRSRRLLAVNDGKLYVARVDADDLEWLERYSYPSMLRRGP